MSSISVKELLAGSKVNETVCVEGWLKTARHGKGFSFLEVYDGSCFGSLQCVADANLANYEEVKKLNTGCAVRIDGKLVASQGKGQQWEVAASAVEPVGMVDADYPLQKKRHSLEFLRTIEHLRLRTNTLGAVMRVRNVAAAAIHGFFQQNGFVWLHTPIITASDSEGAGQMFQVTTLDMENPPRGDDGKVDYNQDFFGVDSRLTVSGQLEGEAGALALKKIYTFGPTFRAENSHTSRHLAEFWMVEPEAAFMDLSGDMELAEAFLKHLFKSVMEAVPDDLEFFNTRIESGLLDVLQSIVDSPFEHLTYTKAVELLEKSGENFEFPVKWGVDLQSEHERYLTETLIKRPVIVTDYPKDIKAFYMYLNDDEKTVRGMDVLVPRVGEIIGGAERECRPEILLARMRECGLNPDDYTWYVDLRRFGSTPHAGFGLGFERAVQFITGMQNIRDVIPFPRTPGGI
jgi:asparaginyl-tRNA synthetase